MFWPRPTRSLQSISAAHIRQTGITVDSRVRLLPPNDSRRGTVKYIGPVPEIPGLGAWVGVALDEPTGKNNGTVNGTAYFDCPASSGVFVRAERIEVGDFPELNELGSDEEF